MDKPNDAGDYLPVADIEVTAVRPGRAEFLMQGRGADGADYRLEIQLEMPLDRKTQTVLGEIFAQSDWRLLRRASKPLRDKIAKRQPSTSQGSDR